MKYLADENFPNTALKRLKDAGVDIVSIPSELKQSPDRAVLELATSEGRIVVTFDKDFGELLFRRGAGTVGVVLFRLSPAGRDWVVHRTCEVLRTAHNFEGSLTVVELDRIRVRRLSDT